MDFQVPQNEVWYFGPGDHVYFEVNDISTADLDGSGTMRVKKSDASRNQVITILEGDPATFDASQTDLQQLKYFKGDLTLRAGERFLISHEEPTGGSGLDVSSGALEIPFTRYVRQI